MYELGSRLKELRKKFNLTQEQVAVKLDLTKSSVYSYENNIRRPPNDVIKQFCLLYNVSADFLMGINNREYICVDGMTESQKEALNIFLTEFGIIHKKN